MRCLALAQACKEIDCDVVFAVGMDIGVLTDRLLSEGFEVARLQAQPGSLDDAAETVALAMKRVARWIVADGYHFNTSYQKVVKQRSIQLLYIDDAGYADEYAADIILNQNISAHKELYAKRSAGSRLLLGPRYALLRREFWSWRGRQRAVKTPPRKILVSLGGSDPDNVTLTVLRALRQLDRADVEVRIVIGAANPNGDSLRREMPHLPGGCELVVNTHEMPQLMAWADMAVTAGGSTCWELAMMGLPMLVMILADNQQGIATGLAAQGSAINLGWRESLDETTVAQALANLLLDGKHCQEMSRCGQELVDGFGASRVANILNGET